MTWVENNTKSIQKIRAYISDFQPHKPTLFQFFQGEENPLFPDTVGSDRGIGILLFFCALYQNISESKLIELLVFLRSEFGTDLFKLNRLPFEELQKKIDSRKELSVWDLKSKAPGILRSVCDFFYAKGRVPRWIESCLDAEQCVQILSDEIFMMGKTSSTKGKARYFIWLMTQLPGVIPDPFWGNKMNLPVTQGQVRFLREFGPLKDKKKSPWNTPEEKQDYFNRFYRMLFPGKSWMVYISLDSYLKPTRESSKSSFLLPEFKSWRCRDLLGGCLNCALVADCPGRVEF